jgi:hypothetical protein
LKKKVPSAPKRPSVTVADIPAVNQRLFLSLLLITFFFPLPSYHPDRLFVLPNLKNRPISNRLSHPPKPITPRSYHPKGCEEPAEQHRQRRFKPISS